MSPSANDISTSLSGSRVARYSTFTVAGRLYGIEVTCVQEVVRPMPLTPVPLAPGHIVGLINLRGQVVTAIGLRELFSLPSGDSTQLFNVVCKTENILLSLLVDEIGDVVEVKAEDFESTPGTISPDVRRFMSGIYKVNDILLSVIELNPIARFLGLVGKENSVLRSSAAV